MSYNIKDKITNERVNPLLGGDEGVGWNVMSLQSCWIGNNKSRDQDITK